MDVDLTGMILGMNLNTKPEEIYRALIEATAYGANIIIDAFDSNGVAVNEIVACGGLAEKNALLMQIYADVTNREWKIASLRKLARSVQLCGVRWRRARAEEATTT